jgi:ketosteroid isomerase-like protein
MAFSYSEVSRDPGRETANLELARRYLSAIEASTDPTRAGGEQAADFFHPDVLQEEFPNRFVPTGAKRDLAALKEAGARGRAVLQGQRYEVRAAYALADTVILEVLWVGKLALQIGALTAGQEMRAHFAVFLEFRDGLIYRQRNYDCFEPF